MNKPEKDYIKEMKEEMKDPFLKFSTIVKTIIIFGIIILLGFLLTGSGL